MVAKAKTKTEEKVESSAGGNVAETKTHLPSKIAEINMEEDAEKNSGFENVNLLKDLAVPYLAILQSGSPQVKRGDPKKIEGATEGDLFNTVSSEVFPGDKGVRVIPCTFQKRWVEWQTRESGGGFVMAHDTEAILATTRPDAKKRSILPNGNAIVATAYHYVLIVKDDGSFEPAIIALSSTQLKKSKLWLGRMNGIQLTGAAGKKYRPPVYSHSYVLSTIVESNDQGSWCGWDIGAPQPLDLTTESGVVMYNAAKALSKAVNEGTVKISTPAPDAGAESKSDESF